jgi:hypothetical protein
MVTCALATAVYGFLLRLMTALALVRRHALETKVRDVVTGVDIPRPSRGARACWRSSGWTG